MWKLDMSDINVNTSCYDSMISLFLKSNGFEYQLMNLKKFSSNHLLIDEKGECHLTRGTKNNDVLSEIFSITCRVFVKSEIVDFHSCINNNLKIAPVGLIVNSYDCNWTSFYKRTNIKHFILVIDYDQNYNKYTCIDIYYPIKGQIILTSEQLERICESIYIYRFMEVMPDSLSKSLFYLKKRITIPDSKCFEIEKNNMIDFIIEIPQDVIATVDKLDVSPFLLKLKWISEDKIDFKSSLQYMDEKMSKPIFNSLYSNLQEISQQVNWLKNSLIRYVMTKSLNSTKVKMYIERIYDMNYEVAYKIKKILE